MISWTVSSSSREEESRHSSLSGLSYTFGTLEDLRTFLSDYSHRHEIHPRSFSSLVIQDAERQGMSSKLRRQRTSTSTSLAPDGSTDTRDIPLSSSTILPEPSQDFDLTTPFDFSTGTPFDSQSREPSPPSSPLRSTSLPTFIHAIGSNGLVESSSMQHWPGESSESSFSTEEIPGPFYPNNSLSFSL